MSEKTKFWMMVVTLALAPIAAFGSYRAYASDCPCGDACPCGAACPCGSH